LTQHDALIEKHGVSVTILEASYGIEDSRGFPAETWSIKATERCWIQENTLRGEATAFSDAGERDTSTHTGFFKKDSVIAEKNVVSAEGKRYQALKVRPMKLFGSTLHVEAYMRLMDEGEI